MFISWNGGPSVYSVRSGGVPCPVVVYLDPVIFFVADVYKPKGVRSDSPRIVEPTVAGTLTSERPQKSAGRVQHLRNENEQIIKFAAHVAGRHVGEI